MDARSRGGAGAWQPRRWRVYGLIAGCCLLATWILLVSWLVLALHPFSSDWNVYYDTARALRAVPHINLSLYATTAWGGSLPGGCPLWVGDPYTYPPLLAIVLAPLTTLPCWPATVVWRILTLALWGASAVALALPQWRTRAWGQTLMAVALVTLFPPLIDGMLLGQVHLVILVCCLAGVALVARGRLGLGGGVFAAGAWIKYVPAALIAYYALTGRWRVARGAAIAAGALLAAQLAIVGPASLLESFSPAARASLAPSDAAWSGLPGGIIWGLAACALFATGVVAAQRLSARQGSVPPDDALGVGWALCSMLLLSPVVWWLYLTWLLPAFWACWQAITGSATRQQRPSLWTGAAGSGWRWVAGSGLGVALALTLIPFNHIAITGVSLTLWAVCGALYLRSAAGRQPVDSPKNSSEAPAVSVPSAR